MDNTIFNLDPRFVDTLDENELSALQSAHGTMEKISAKYNEWQNGYSDEGLRQHLADVARQQREEMESSDRLKARFK